MVDAVVEDKRKDNMADLVNRGAEPCSPENPFPSDSTGIDSVNLGLEFGEDKAEDKKNPQNTEDLDERGVECGKEKLLH